MLFSNPMTSAGALGCHHLTEVTSRGSGPGCPRDSPGCACPFPVPSPFPPLGKAFWGVLIPPGPLWAPRAVRSLLHLPSPSLFKSHHSRHASPVCQLSPSSNYALRLRRRSSSLSRQQTDTWRAASCPTPDTQPCPTSPSPGWALAGAEHRARSSVTPKNRP